MLEQQTHRIPVDDGELHVEIAGSGPPVVLIHAGYLDASMWDQQLDALTPSYTVIRYDARSQGRSSTAMRDHYPDQDLRALLDALDVPAATVVGNSFGGAVASSFALMHPERVRGLVLCGPGITPMEFRDPFILELYKEQRAALEAMDAERYVEAFLRYGVDGPHREPDEVDGDVRQRCHDMAMRTIANHHTATGALLERDTAARLEQIAAPTLLVVGELELSDLHRVVQDADRRMPDSRLAQLDGIGHMTSMERPEEFNALLLEFLGGLA